jgi:hypothetical protein
MRKQAGVLLGWGTTHQCGEDFRAQVSLGGLDWLLTKEHLSFSSTSLQAPPVSPLGQDDKEKPNRRQRAAPGPESKAKKDTCGMPGPNINNQHIFKDIWSKNYFRVLYSLTMNFLCIHQAVET